MLLLLVIFFIFPSCTVDPDPGGNFFFFFFGSGSRTRIPDPNLGKRQNWLKHEFIKLFNLTLAKYVVIEFDPMHVPLYT